MRQLFQEIFASIRRNRLRTFLTGFSVAWGIFMLVVLLGAGNGLKNGVASNFSGRYINTMSVYNSVTTLPFEGFQRGRYVQLRYSDAEYIKNEFPHVIESVSSRKFYGNSLSVSFENNHGMVDLIGMDPEGLEVEAIKILKGRFINQADMVERRKSVVLGDKTADVLFEGRNPIGSVVNIGDLCYTVIGVFELTRVWGSPNAYIPLETMFITYNNGQDYVGGLTFKVKGIDDKEKADALNKQVKQKLAAKYRFDPNDSGGLYVYNRMEEYMDTMMIFNGIMMFIWLVGIGTLVAGVAGVSNIMMVTVKERTYEFGIRKALGAKPSSILSMVMVEAVVITSMFGYVGMVLGIAVMEAVNAVMVGMGAGRPSGGEAVVMFKDPTVSLSLAVGATFILIIAGIVAGYVPAKHSVKIKTIDAMRSNK